jgi:hypothetical protein
VKEGDETADSSLVQKKRTKTMVPPLPAPPSPSASSSVYTASRKHRLHQVHAYRPSSTAFNSNSAPEFEIVQKAHPLRYVLATLVASCGSVARLSTSLFGLVPDNSLLDKCPYYRTASEEHTPNLPASLKWVAEVQQNAIGSKTSKSRVSIDSSLVGYRKRYRRDNFTLPAMVAVYNTALVWMMFNIEVRASSL